VYGAYRLVRYREYAFALIFTAIFMLFLPSTLALAFPEENPSVVRAGGAIPFVMTLAALPLGLLFRRLTALGARGLALAVLLPLLFWTVKINYDLYFLKYDEQYRRAAWNSSEIASVLRQFSTTLGDERHAYLVSAPHWVDHRAVGIHLGNPRWDNRVLNVNDIREQADDNAAKLYVLKAGDIDSLSALRDTFPTSVVRLVKSRSPGRDFVAVFVPPR
jgi:hypothetical protein